MINVDNILDENSYKLALWCNAESDSTDLAYVANQAVTEHFDAVSVVPSAVSVLWPWLEGKRIDIFSRFYLSEKSKSDDVISELTSNINYVFKQGADGVQIFIRLSDLSNFVSKLYIIRDDLFFNKSLYIGLDISDVDAFDWKNVFDALRKIRASGLLLALPVDKGDKSDFIGRLYAALDAWNPELDCDLHFAFGRNFLRIEQAYRLVETMRPKLLDKIKFFVNV